jgi:hypothetical protein
MNDCTNSFSHTINREEKVLPVQKGHMERMERTEILESQYVVKY